MISEVIELVKAFDSLVAAIITGGATFLITRYSFNRNIPLDKMEIAYNRVYYPVFQLIKRSDNVEQMVAEIEPRLLKYGKYVDLSTMKAFQYLKENLETSYKKKAFQNFKDNILAFDIKLRKRLGYLDPSVMDMYRYADPKDKRAFRMTLEVAGVYSLALFTSVFSDESIIAFISGVFVVLCGSFIIECCVWFLEVVCKWIGRIFVFACGKCNEWVTNISKQLR